MKHRIVVMLAFLVMGTFALSMGATHVSAHSSTRSVPQCESDQCNGLPVEEACSSDASLVRFARMSTDKGVIIGELSLWWSRSCDAYYGQLKSVGGTRLMSLSIRLYPLSYPSGSRYVDSITSPMVAKDDGTVYITGTVYNDADSYDLEFNY
ncbi:MAG TPA: hypothetical protein VL485_18845 [Ktedonobacteraceae bacterium]|jgi:hypothetical protein|nr:hypothetical protein [Ktedonobacteraceae bacterium]